MSDSQKLEVQIVADASGATKAFAAISDGSKKATADLTRMGQAGSQSLKQLSGSIGDSGQAADRSAESVGHYGASVERGAKASFNFARIRMVDLLIHTGQAAGTANEQFAAFASTVDTVIHGAGGLVHGLDPTLIALGAVASAVALATEAYAEHAQIDEEMVKAEQSVTAAILNNVSATDRATASRVKFAGVDMLKPLDIGPWNAAGQAVAAHTSLIDRLTGNYGAAITTTGQATKATEDYAAATGAAAANEVPHLTDAFLKLADAANTYAIGGNTLTQATGEINAIMQQSGPAGQVMRAELEAAIEDFQHDGDATKFAAAIEEITHASYDAAAGLNTLTQAQADFVKSLPDKLRADAADELGQYKDKQQGRIDAANQTAKALTEQAQAEGAARAKAITQASGAAVAADKAAGRDRVREASVAERQITMAAENTADAQIAAAKTAQEQTVQAAQDAADGQIEAAQRAENQQVNASERAGHAQVRAATAAGHDQVRAADLAATRQIAAVERWASQANDAATAHADAVVTAAKTEEDARVSAADDAADAEIAAAKRSTQQQLDQLDRRTAKQELAATEDANRIIQQANDQAAHKIRASGGDPHVVAQQAKNLAKIQGDAIDEQVRKQEHLVAAEDKRREQIQSNEEASIKAIEDRRDAIHKDSEAKITAITEAAQEEEKRSQEAISKEVERVRTDATRRATQVERAATRETGAVQKQTSRETAQVQRDAARNTAAVQKQAAEQVAATQKAAAATAAKEIDKINLEREQTERQASRDTQRAQAESEKALRVDDRETTRELTRNSRQVKAETTAAANDRERVETHIRDKIIAKEKELHRSVNQTMLALAKASPEIAAILEQEGEISKGADGKIRISTDPPSQTLLNEFNSVFGPGHAEVQANGTIHITGDWTAFKAQLAGVNVRAVSPAGGGTGSAASPVGTANPAPSGPLKPIFDAVGNIVGWATGTQSAASHGNGGVISRAGNGAVLVGEYGPEWMQNGYVRPAPATAASREDGGVHVHFHGPVYGLPDFEAQVGQVALHAFAKHMPHAIRERRRALGAT